MHPRAVATSLVALSLAFVVVVWMGRASQEPIVESEPAPAVDENRPQISESGPHPVAVFEETTYDFGTMKHQDEGSHKFVVKNTGQAPLEMAAGDTTCQCTIGELGASVVPPGESTVIELKWKIKSPAPTFSHTAEIWTNDPSNQMVLLRISGNVGRDVVFRPEGSWDMGSIPAISEGRVEGIVISQTRPKLELEKVEMIDSDAFSIEVDPMSAEQLNELHVSGALMDQSSMDRPPSPPIVGYTVRVQLVKEVPIGPFTHRLKFQIKFNDEVPVFEQLMEVTGNRSGPFDFFPLPGARWYKKGLMMQAGTVDATKGKKTGLILLVRGAGESFQVTDLSSDLKWLKLSHEAPERAGNATRVKLNVEFPPDSPRMSRPQQNPARITVKTSHPDAAVIDVRLTFATN